MNEFFILDLDTNLCTAEVWINGLPVVRCSYPDGVQAQLPVHEYFVPGPNKFQLVVEPGPTPSRTFEANPKPFAIPEKFFARMRLMRMPAGAFPEDPGVQVIFDLNYRPPAGTLLPVPAIFDAECGAPPWTGLASWTDAQPVPDTPVARNFIAAFLDQLAQAMNAGNIESYLAAARIRFQEVSTAYQLSPEEQTQAFRAQFQRLSADPGFKMEPVTADSLDLRWCAGGRVVECIDRNWQPALRALPAPGGGPSPYRIPAKVAFFNRELHIVR